MYVRVFGQTVNVIRFFCRYHRIKRRAEKRAASKQTFEQLQEENPELAKTELEKAERLRVAVCRVKYHWCYGVKNKSACSYPETGCNWLITK